MFQNDSTWVRVRVKLRVRVCVSVLHRNGTMKVPLTLSIARRYGALSLTSG